MKDCPKTFFAHRTMGALYPWCSSDMLGCSSRRLHHCPPWESPSHRLPQVVKCTVHCMALQFIMITVTAGALGNFQAFGRVKICLARSGCVMARESSGPHEHLEHAGIPWEWQAWDSDCTGHAFLLLLFPDSGRDSWPSSSNALDSKSP